MKSNRLQSKLRKKLSISQQWVLLPSKRRVNAAVVAARSLGAAHHEVPPLLCEAASNVEIWDVAATIASSSVMVRMRHGGCVDDVDQEQCGWIRT